MSASAPMTPSSSGLRNRLLNAAEVEIGESGVGGASLRAVARRAGVSHQAPAYAFAHRRGMLTALATRYFDRLAEQLLATTGCLDDRPALERLAAIGMAYVEFAQSHPALFSLTASPDQIDLEDAALGEARERAWSLLHDVVLEAQQEGWRDDQPAGGVAMTCWVLVHGSAALWREGWLEAQFPGVSVRELVRGMLLNTM